MKKKLISILIITVLSCVLFGSSTNARLHLSASDIQYSTPILDSVNDPQYYAGRIADEIYPGSIIKIFGKYLCYNNYAKEGIGIFFNGNEAKEYSLSSISCNGVSTMTLPRDIPIGSNYLQVKNYYYLVSNPIYFEVKRNICTESDWSCGNWSSCNVEGVQSRSCRLLNDCENPESVKPNENKECIPTCREDKWQCGQWSSCSGSGQQTRICIKSYDCPLIENEKPATEQNCTYVPPYVAPSCLADIWACGSWSSCSPAGIKTRSCSKTFDCGAVENAMPATSEYCTPAVSPSAPSAPSAPVPSAPSGIDYNRIIKSTVALECPIDLYRSDGGSGTIIDSSGIVLTNAHVPEGTLGFCRVGFVNSMEQKPRFSEIADVIEVCSNCDAAILKIRNSSNRVFTDIDIGTYNNFVPGESILAYGYPSLGGDTLTTTRGSFGGFTEDIYIKSDIAIAPGNSGGGAYLDRNGVFIGMPTKFTLKERDGVQFKISHILSVNKIVSWFNSTFTGGYVPSPKTYNSLSINFDWSRVKIIENEENDVTEEPENFDFELAKRLSGRILLQVESVGQAWYINPTDYKRYYLGRPADAFAVMRKLSLGVRHDFLVQYADGFPSRVLGKILLDVEDNGRCYYINPQDELAYYLGRPLDAFAVMRAMGLGITNENLNKIEVGKI